MGVYSFFYYSALDPLFYDSGLNEDWKLISAKSDSEGFIRRSVFITSNNDMVIIDNTGDINSFIHGFYEAIIFEVNSSEQEPLEDSISTLRKAMKGKMIPVVAIGDKVQLPKKIKYVKDLKDAALNLINAIDEEE